MRNLAQVLVTVGMLVAAPVAMAVELVNIPMDQQITHPTDTTDQSPNGDAIYEPANFGDDTLIFTSDPNDPDPLATFTRILMSNQQAGGDGWYYGYIDLNLASVGSVDITDPCTTIEFDGRVYNDPTTNTNPYGDANIFFRAYSYASDGSLLGFRTYGADNGGIVYGPNDSRFPFGDWYPTWSHIVVEANSNFTDGGTPGFDPTAVNRFRFFGTNWAGGGDDFTDLRDFVIKVEILPPVIGEVADHTAFTDVPYVRQVTVDSCDPNVAWSVVTGPAGLTITPTGTGTAEVSGWTPTSAGVVAIEVMVTNDAGANADTESWNVTVEEPPTLEDSNIASPWGTIHGNISGTQSSADPLLTFSDAWANGAEQDWTLSTAGFTQRGGISFDEEANLYFKTSDGFLHSVTPDGTSRWTTASSLGMGDTTTPVVGDGGPTGRVYVLSDAGVSAFQKSDGAELWSTPLPDADFASTGDRLTPVLYNGILYAVGTGGSSKAVYAVNVADGSVIWNQSIAVSLDLAWGDAKGQMTLVPDAFGAGVHGLYFNADGSGTGSPDVYAIGVDANSFSGSLQWAANGGKAARSHVIYSSTTGRLYTHTWGDDNAEFYSFDPVNGLLFENNNGIDSTHGFNDFGALDFNGTDVIASGFSGNYIRYHDTSDGSTTDAFFATNPDFGEGRMYGGLYQDSAGDSIVVTATREAGVTNEQVLAFNADTQPLTDCTDFDDSPLFVDNFTITHGATGTETTRLDAAGFEGYTLGDLPGQLNPGGTGAATWEDDTGGGPSGVGMVQVVDALPAGGSGKGIVIDAAGGCGGWQGVFANLGENFTDDVVIVSWDQYRDDLTDNEWVADHPNFDAWYAIAWDQNGSIYPRQFDDNGGASPPVPLTAGVWQHIEYRFNFASSTVTVTVAGVGSSTVALDAAETDLRGWVWEMAGTLEDDDFVPEPVTPIFSYDTGLFNPDFIAGMIMGPRPQSDPSATQRIYYFESGTGNLVAITPIRLAPGDFDGDGDVDTDDAILFELCASAPEVPVDPGCEHVDLDGDGDGDQSDFAIFQRCISGPNIPADPDCAN